MDRIKFDPKELEPVGYIPSPIPGEKGLPILNTPVPPRDNFMLMLERKKPLWMPMSSDYMIVAPTCMPDSWAHGVVFGPGITDEQRGGKDMFGVEWEFVTSAHGAMVRPGNPLVKDITHWEDYITFPNIDEWDWASAKEDVRAAKERGCIIRVAQMTGLFERLISFVDMTDALMSMIDEDAIPAIHRLFDYLCNLYDRLFEKYKKYLDADIVWFMDDWGTQRAPFFSEATLREMLLPYLQRVVQSAHKYGMYLDFHSDGKLDSVASVIADTGCDLWEGQILNDKEALIAQYGDRFIFNTQIDVPANATEAEMKAAVEKYFRIYGDKPAYCECFGLPPECAVYLYEMSRKAYNT